MLLAEGDTRSAITAFAINVQSYPRSANAHDSLAEAYLHSGDRRLASRHFAQVVALDPDNGRAKRASWELERLGF